LPDYQTVFDDSAFQKTTASVLPDNSTGQIDAQDVRDMYATLRDRDTVKLVSYSSTASLTIDLSAGPVQQIVLKNNIGSVSFENCPPVNLLYYSEDITNVAWGPVSRGQDDLHGVDQHDAAPGLSGLRWRGIHL
jgi:hypothetical protein